MWARIENGIVRELTDVDPSGRFHPSLVWKSAPAEVASGWIEQEDGTLAPPPQQAVADLAADKLSEINVACDAALAAIKSGYPESEVSTWGKQEQEARAHLADPTASVPFLTALAVARGVTVADLAGRVVVKADAYTAAAAAAVGKRQALEDQAFTIVAANALPPEDPDHQDDATARAAIEALGW